MKILKLTEKEALALARLVGKQPMGITGKPWNDIYEKLMDQGVSVKKSPKEKAT